MMYKIFRMIGILLMTFGALVFFGALIYLWIMIYIESDSWLERMFTISGGMCVIGLICGFISIHEDF